ncbi:acyl-CoA synthetase [Allorhizocola rhizosphaerae]|uniref:acyl-CoA synthetase n=1 Tax=Allorhizocola rhizosphaerae TaxID=1872709 RepID=UPI000E3D2B10|nr:acyl-CoA synthetase [Allorhizocola rhizosphaerae]
MTTTIGLWNIATATPGATAIIEPGGRETTYGELVAAADRYACGLQALGLCPGDSIVLLQPNGPVLVELYFAAIQIGLYVVPVNWHLTAPEVGHILSDCGARVLIADGRFAEVASAVDAEFKFGDVPGFEPLERLRKDGKPDGRTAGAPMVYTSGTSGRPKGVKRPLTGASPDQVPPTAAWFFGLFGLKPFDGHVHLCGSPLYHAAVLNFVTISLQFGHPVVLMDHWDPRRMLELIERHRVTHTHMVPTQFRRLLSVEGRQRYDVSSMRAAIHGAAPCPQQVKRDMLDWWGPVVVEYYAASEGGGALITAQEWLERPGSVGKAWPGSTVRVLDADGNDMPPGEPGQVYMQMGTSTFEYHKDEAKTRAARMGSMFTVGDIGYLDKDGYLYLCDRSSDLIISGGVNIYPAEIESELSCHPKVADVAVFGIPHEDWGEEIKAVVQPVAGVQAGPALTEELLAFAATRLARFKLPKSVDYIAEMPRDPNGKLYKRRLRDPYWAGRERVI